jgi:hypothetical protein
MYSCSSACACIVLCHEKVYVLLVNICHQWFTTAVLSMQKLIVDAAPVITQSSSTETAPSGESADSRYEHHNIIDYMNAVVRLVSVMYRAMFLANITLQISERLSLCKTAVAHVSY